MNYQYSHLAVSSFMLWLDNRIQSQTGFYLTNSQFYPINQTYAGYKVYSGPFGALVGDTSVTNNVLTGVYIDNTFTPVGTYPLSGINYEKSQIYLDSNFSTQNPISGANYAIKEVNTVMANFPDISMLFESKLQLRPKMPQIPTGLNNNILTYPSIFIKNDGNRNEPWEFGGIDATTNIINCYIFCESLYQLDAVCNLIQDARYKYVPLFNPWEMPYNNMGGYVSGRIYNYQQTAGQKVAQGYSALIESVEINDFGKRGLSSEIENMTTDAFFALATINLWKPRLTS